MPTHTHFDEGTAWHHKIWWKLIPTTRTETGLRPPKGPDRTLYDPAGPSLPPQPCCRLSQCSTSRRARSGRVLNISLSYFFNELEAFFTALFVSLQGVYSAMSQMSYLGQGKGKMVELSSGVTDHFLCFPVLASMSATSPPPTIVLPYSVAPLPLTSSKSLASGMAYVSPPWYPTKTFA